MAPIPTDEPGFDEARATEGRAKPPAEELVFGELAGVGALGEATVPGDAAGDDEPAEEYVDMGEVWGYDEDGRLRTVREETILTGEEMAGPAGGKGAAPGSARRKRAEASGERKKPAEKERAKKPSAGPARRAEEKRRGSRA